MPDAPLPDLDPLAGRLALSPERAAHALDIGLTRVYELIKAGDLEAYKEGRATRITVESIRAHRDRQIQRARASRGVHGGVGSPAA